MSKENLTKDELTNQISEEEGFQIKYLTHLQIGIIYFLFSFFSIILQLLVFSSFYYKRELLKRKCFIIIFHHGVLSFIQQICHILTSIIIIFYIQKIELLLTIIGSLLNSTFIGSILFIFLLTLNRFDVFYNLNFFNIIEKRKFYHYAIIVCYILIVGLFSIYLYPSFSTTFDLKIYQWKYVHSKNCHLGYQLENKTIYIFLGISFLLQALIVIKIFKLRCYTSKPILLIYENFRILIHAFMCFVTTLFLELIWSGIIFKFYWKGSWLILPTILFIFHSVSNSIFILCFVK
uniref:Serpentine Receptor, class Z n=1 Tax=Strongyloides papillosus TaxID=174720 RepID=A0A0N5C668_STREA